MTLNLVVVWLIAKHGSTHLVRAYVIKLLITFFLYINLGEEMVGIPGPDIPSSSNYAYNLGIQPTLGIADHPYPSIVSNMF